MFLMSTFVEHVLTVGSQVSSGITQSHPSASDSLRTEADAAADQQAHQKGTVADTE